ncbi:MAG: hypothetical protein NTY73_04610 [Candidatus Micrarchaeota archaeon]|nr:hypothetical protein [Candidatus Micrarchaeota archaeon]
MVILMAALKTTEGKPQEKIAGIPSELNIEARKILDRRIRTSPRPELLLNPNEKKAEKDISTKKNLEWEGVELKLEGKGKDSVWTGKLADNYLMQSPIDKSMTRAINISLETNGTIGFTSKIIEKKDRIETLLQDVRLRFNQSGELVDIELVNTPVIPWSARSEDLEKTMKEFLKNPKVGKWLEEQNKLHGIKKHFQRKTVLTMDIKIER